MLAQKGSFWFCNENHNFFCSEDESYLYEKATGAWKRSKRYPIANNHTAFRNTISSRRKRRRMSLLSGNINQRTISGIQPTVLQTLHPHSMFQNLASHAESTVRCAYCRTIYPYEDSCFLYLQEYTEKLTCTNCCHAKVHTECPTALTTLLSLLTYDHSLECGQVVHCNQLWLDV